MQTMPRSIQVDAQPMRTVERHQEIKEKKRKGQINKQFLKLTLKEGKTCSNIST